LTNSLKSLDYTKIAPNSHLMSTQHALFLEADHDAETRLTTPPATLWPERVGRQFGWRCAVCHPPARPDDRLLFSDEPDA